MPRTTYDIDATTRIRYRLDPDHIPYYDLDTPTATSAAVEHESNMIASGAWEPRILILETMCYSCHHEHWYELDSVYGYVCEPSEPLHVSASNAGLISE